MIEVYHGGTEPISHPLVSAGREGLDFGKGFYVTLMRDYSSRIMMLNGLILLRTAVPEKLLGKGSIV